MRDASSTKSDLRDLSGDSFERWMKAIIALGMGLVTIIILSPIAFFGVLIYAGYKALQHMGVLG